jgi:hypothetical protein
VATKDDSGGLMDRRSIRELIETKVGGKKAPRSAKAQLANSKELKRRLKKEKLRRMKLK